MKKPLPGKSTLITSAPTPIQEVVRQRGVNTPTPPLASQPLGFPPIERQAPTQTLPNSGYKSNIWFGNVEEEETRVRSEKIKVDEVGLPPPVYPQFQPQTPPQIQTAGDNFYLMIKGKMVHTTSTLQEMEEVLEHYLFAEETPYPNLTIDDVIVLMKMNAKVGVSLRA